MAAAVTDSSNKEPANDRLQEAEQCTSMVESASGCPAATWGSTGSGVTPRPSTGTGHDIQQHEMVENQWRTPLATLSQVDPTMPPGQ